jgi:hypothetical protein
MSSTTTAPTLTPEQIAIFPNYISKWTKIGLSTGECDILAAIDCAKQAYAMTAQVDPEVHEPHYFFGPYNNPIEAAYAEHVIDDVIAKFPAPQDAAKEMNRRVEEHFSKPNVDLSSLKISNQIFGAMEASWLLFYDFFLTEHNHPECQKVAPLIEMAKVCGWWTPLEDACIFQHRPSALHFDDQDRLHCDDGPAIAFRGSELCNFYYIHGVRVSKQVVERTFTAQDIDKESNAEIRRIMVERYGHDRYIIDSGISPIHTDDYGKLYRKEIPNDEPMFVVQVTNSTREPDGTFKEYWIRVDPNAYGGLKTARAAVASTWRHADGSMIFSDPNEYVLVKET